MKVARSLSQEKNTRADARAANEPTLRTKASYVFAAILATWPLAQACSSSSGPTMPVECGSGAVMCMADSICCPSAQPFFCGGPTDPDNLGCYATLQDATAVCGMTTVNGKTMTIAYQCR